MVNNAIHKLIIGLAVPLLGGLLTLPVVAQTTEPEGNRLLSTELPPTRIKPPGANIVKWPPLPDEHAEQPVKLVVQLSERQLYVFRGETLATSFPIAVGKAGWETPTGTFEVSYMLENPGWTNPFTGEVMAPGPDNPLGERWIAFWTDGQNEIGFHGTPNRTSIGQAASHGCVRLYNEHIRELYDLVTPGTLVTVLP